ncbi:uncharacterized protein zgc:113229 isoform X2 [Myxocyprinus asiaticus]|uniref:uncharacterized protein zgc:113229 isoform X2 n=1 Tax=Myxocyprinus asiaticus TaxID=70543 RepID=UPI002223EAB1|nr:uncharacterized protein zgc:113229 isoform X2 [Myxocyprinus asiaticus]
MAENPVSDTQSLLESMLQKLRVNTQTNNSSHTDMQTCSLPVMYYAETMEDSSKATVYQFEFSSSNKEQDRHSIQNKCENPWTQQSVNFRGTQAPFADQLPKRIRRVSSKPKHTPLIWGEHNHFPSERSNDAISCVGEQEMPNVEKRQQFSLKGETKGVYNSSVLPLYKTEPYRNPPDLLAPTLATSTSVLDKPEVKGQSGTWSWDTEKEKNEGTRVHEESGKRTSKKKWRDAKRWAQRVKERWRERHRSTETRQRDDGERQVQSEVLQSNLSPISMPIDVNTTTAVTENPNIHNEPINTELDESTLCSLSDMSENLFSFGTSNLMEEIFNGTKWAQFLTVNCTTQDQSQESPSISQSCKEEWNGKWNHTKTIDSHSANEHSVPQLISIQQSHSQPQVSDTSHNQPQGGKEVFIPILDSYVKPMDRSSIKSHGSLSRKREHWTRRRNPFEDSSQDMEDEYHCRSTSSISPMSTLTSLQNSVSEDSDSYKSLETVIKKMRMEESRHVRFAEEVVILPPSFISEDEDDCLEDDCPEEPSPRSSFPKWIGSLKVKQTRKYKF